VNPRLSEEAEQVSADYSENAEFIKLFLPTGEIDIVVGTALTEQPFEQVAYAGRDIKLETCGEIIAKKMWHRGYQAKARDLFDLCAVADAEPEAIDTLGFRRSFADCLSQAHSIIKPILAGTQT